MATAVSTGIYSNMFDFISSRSHMIERLDYTNLDANGKPTKIIVDGTQDIMRRIMERDPNTIGSNGQRNFDGTGLSIQEYFGVELPDNNSTKTQQSETGVILDLSSNIKSSDPTTIDWSFITNRFKSHIQPEREQSIERIAAEYAIQKARIQQSDLNDDEKQIMQGQLIALFDSVKTELGVAMADELQTFLEDGDVDADYSSLGNAVGEIIKDRVNEYDSLLSSLLTNGEFDTRYAAWYLVEKMYQQKNVTQRSKNDDEVINIDGKDYTYGEIKGVFDGIKYISEITNELNDPGFYPTYFPWPEETYSTFGYYGMAFSMLTNRYENGALYSDVHSAMMNQFSKGAVKLRADPDEAVKAISEYEKVPLDSNGFASRLVKIMLKYQPFESDKTLDAGDKSYIHKWNQLIMNTNNIDASKYHVGVDMYAG